MATLQQRRKPIEQSGSSSSSTAPATASKRSSAEQGRVLSNAVSDAIFAASAATAAWYWCTSFSPFSYRRETALAFLLLAMPASFGSIRFSGVSSSIIPLHDFFTLLATYSSLPILALVMHHLRHDSDPSPSSSTSSSSSSSLPAVLPGTLLILVIGLVISVVFYETRKKSLLIKVSKLVLHIIVNASLIYDGYLFMRRGGKANHDGGFWSVLGSTTVVLSGVVVGNGEPAWKIDLFHLGMAFAVYALSQALNTLTLSLSH